MTDSSKRKPPEEINAESPVSGTPAAGGKLYIHTFGCQMNEYDSLKIKRVLQNNYSSVDTPEEADLILLNTCTVRQKPEQKVYSMLGRLKQLRSKRKDLLIGVCGCMAQQEGENIIKRSKTVDFVFGTHNISLVPALVALRKQGYPPQVAIDYRDEWEELPLGLPGDGRISVPVAISRGCNKNCSYCIVPRTRGAEVSRPADEIEREIKLAVHRGAREVLLLGQTVNSYGLDLQPRSSFVALLQRLSEISGLRRVRFTSPHPQEMRRDLIDFFAANEKLCRHIHMPLQSGSDVILKAMNRNYRRARFLNIIEAFKNRMPEIAVTTDIIVGFPGETEKDFEETLDVMRRVPFDNSYSFVYSARPGTPAAQLPDPVTEEEKFERLARLQSLQESITAERLTGWLGKETEVLVEGRSRADDNVWQGRNTQNIVINFTEVSECPEKVAVGDMIKVSINGVARFTLQGVFTGKA